MQSFEKELRSLNHPGKVYCHAGIFTTISTLFDYSRILLVVSKNSKSRGTLLIVEELLGKRIINTIADVEPNPSLNYLEKKILENRNFKFDAILAIGGGSVIDSAKVFARFANLENDNKLKHYLTEPGLLKFNAIPLVAVPTTSGTGSEVTPFATIWDFEEGRKYSLTGRDLIPAHVVLDPLLTISLPQQVTITSGLDAISHALESVWNKNATQATKNLAFASLKLSIKNLAKITQNLDCLESRIYLQKASFLAGLAISVTQTGLAHSISYPLTTEYKMPHGIACSFTLPEIFKFNLKSSDFSINELLNSLDCAEPMDIYNLLISLFNVVELPKLFKKYVKQKEKVFILSEKMLNPDRSENNILPISQIDLSEILNLSLDFVY
jgi:alcohol dehydrogenase